MNDSKTNTFLTAPFRHLKKKKKKKKKEKKMRTQELIGGIKIFILQVSDSGIEIDFRFPTLFKSLR